MSTDSLLLYVATLALTGGDVRGNLPVVRRLTLKNDVFRFGHYDPNLKGRVSIPRPRSVNRGRLFRDEAPALFVTASSKANRLRQPLSECWRVSLERV